MQQDFLLIRKMKSGDEAAMDAFVQKYYPQILQYCRYHCSNREWAEDLTQETFERFFRGLAGYQHIGKAGNYLYTIARNLCIDFGKKKMEDAVREIPETVENPFCRLDERLDMERALASLEQKLREVVILHFFQGLSMREAAEILGIGIPLVKYRIKRAKELLQDYLEKEEMH